MNTESKLICDAVVLCAVFAVTVVNYGLIGAAILTLVTMALWMIAAYLVIYPACAVIAKNRGIMNHKGIFRIYATISMIWAAIWVSVGINEDEVFEYLIIGVVIPVVLGMLIIWISNGFIKKENDTETE